MTKEKAVDEEKIKVLGSSRLTSVYCEVEQRTVTVTILFWSDGSVTWVRCE